MFVFRNLIIMLLLLLSAFTANAEYVIKDIVDLGRSRALVSATQNRDGVFTAVIKEALTNPVASRYYIAKFDANGFISSYGSNGMQPLVFENNGAHEGPLGIDAIHSLSDGRFLVIGSVNVDSVYKSEWFVGRLNNDGTVDYSFGPDGQGYFISRLDVPVNQDNTVAMDVVEDFDGGYVIGGRAYQDAGNNQPDKSVILKLNHSGNLDINFHNNGELLLSSNNVEPEVVHQLLDLEDGTFLTVEGSSEGNITRISRYDFNGNLVTFFGDNGVVYLQDTVMDVQSGGLRSVFRDGRYIYIPASVVQLEIWPYSIKSTIIKLDLLGNKVETFANSGTFTIPGALELPYFVQLLSNGDIMYESHGIAKVGYRTVLQIIIKSINQAGESQDTYASLEPLNSFPLSYVERLHLSDDVVLAGITNTDSGAYGYVKLITTTGDASTKPDLTCDITSDDVAAAYDNGFSDGVLVKEEEHAIALAQLSEDVIALEGENDTLSDSIVQLNGDIVVLEGENANLSGAVVKLNDDVIALEGMNANLSDTVVKLTSDITALEGEKAGLSDAIGQCEIEKSSLIQELEQAKVDFFNLGVTDGVSSCMADPASCGITHKYIAQLNKRDNGHGNDMDKVDPSNPGKSKKHKQKRNHKRKGK